MNFRDRMIQIGEGLGRLGDWLEVELFHIGGTSVSLATAITFLLIVLATLWISRLLQGGLDRLFLRRSVDDRGTKAVALRLIHYLVLVTGIGIGLHTIGVNLTGLFAAGAVFAVGIGFAMQNLTENFVSGVILLLERSIKPGDILSLEDRMIRVEELGIRSTVARTLDEEDIIIPNSQLVQSTVKNHTLRDKLYRIRVLVGVTYGSDMKLTSEVLTEAASGLGWRNRRKPRVFMQEFADSAVVFEVSVWIDDPWKARERRSQLHEVIWWALKDAGLVIAFPQLDVHFDPPAPPAAGEKELGPRVVEDLER